MYVCLNFDLSCYFNDSWLQIFDREVVISVYFGGLDLFEPGDLFAVLFHVEFLFKGSDDLVGIYVFFLKFLMMRTALEAISGSNEVRHLFVELVGPELVNFYLLFSLDRIFSLEKSIKAMYFICYS